MYFNRFTQRAKTAIDLGVESAKGFGHKIVGTEHLLLGLLKENDGIAAKVLNKLGITEEVLENKIIEIEGKNDSIISDVTLSPRSKQILELSGAFANKLKTNYIGTEHILLALAQEGEGLAMRILASMNIDARDIAESIIDMMGIDNYSIEPKKVNKQATESSSENTSSKESKRLAIKTYKGLNMSPRQYRKTLSNLRRKIDIVETKITNKKYDEID